MGPALVRAAGVGPGQRVLDVGAGTGNATLPAAAAGAHVIGTDVAPELMAIGERAAAGQGLVVDLAGGRRPGPPVPRRRRSTSCCPPSAPCSRPTTRRRPASCCGSAARAGRSRWRTGRPTARRAASSRSSPATARPRRGRRRRPGATPRTVTRLLAPATVTTTRSHVRLAFTGPPGRGRRLLPQRTSHRCMTTFAALDDAQAARLEAELVDTSYSGGYDLEYLTVLAGHARPTGARPGASTGRSG